MPKINVLPGAVSELIAAGEVIERPASIVKELVEDRLGGSISVVSQDGGTVFTIRIPKTRLEADHAAVSH